MNKHQGLRPYICFLILIGGIINNSIAQSGPVQNKAIPESFLRVMAYEKPSTEQIDTILRISYQYLFKNQDSSVLLAQKAHEEAKNLYAGQIIYAKSLLQLGDANRNKGDLEAAEPLYLEGKALYESLGEQRGMANADTKLGAMSATAGKYEDAINYHLSALKTWEELKDTTQLFKPHINIAQVFYLSGRRRKANEYNSRALEIAELKNYTGVMMITLGNRGIFEQEEGEIYQAKVDSLPELRQQYADSAKAFFHQALNSYERALQLAREKGPNKYRMIAFMGSIVSLKTTLKEYEEAIKIGLEADKIAEEVGSLDMTLQNKTYLARAYQESGQQQQTIFHAKVGLEMAAKRELEKSMLDEILYKAYKASGNYELALKHHEAFETYQQEIAEKEEKEAISEIESKYQNVQKEKQILELETTNAKIEKQRNYLFGGAFFLGLLGLLAFQLNKVRKDRNSKIAFAQALMLGQEDERKRIAQDLHDGIGQSLLLIKKQLASNQQVSQENQALVAETLEEVRSISRDLHPFQLEKFGLTAAIEGAIEKIEKHTDLFITSDIENIDKRINEDQQIHIFRTVQEALSNVVKHAEATAAKVSTELLPNETLILVQDNGKGFDHELEIVTHQSLGLKTMFERIAAIGGTLRIVPGEPKGTKIEIRMPV